MRLVPVLDETVPASFMDSVDAPSLSNSVDSPTLSDTGVPSLRVLYVFLQYYYHFESLI